MKQVIYDCDNTMGLPFKEIDDGLTLLYLLGRPDIHLMGVTTIFGNGTTDQAYAQTKELLRRVKRTEIPVFKGQSEPGKCVNEAAEFIARTAAEQPGKISLLATGPLTNLLAAKRLDARLFENTAEVVCMGGYLGPLRIGRRNLAELNLAADPEASLTVLNAACPVTLMSAQLCLQAGFEWGDRGSIRTLDPWLQRTIRNWLLVFGFYFGVRKFYLWDLVAAVYLSHPDLFEGEIVRIRSSIDDLTTGKIILSSQQPLASRLLLPSGIRDVNQFKQILYQGWGRAL